MVHFKWLMVFASILLQTECSDTTVGHQDQKGTPKSQCLTEVEKIPYGLPQYQYLRDLQNSDEEMFYTCLINHVNELLPIVYTPLVGEACENYGLITGPKRGLTLTIEEKDKVEEKLVEWKKSQAHVKAIVVTDGERILGLGDLGANGMGIPVGKMALYSALGGVDPKNCLPVTLDVGTNNKKLLDSKVYVGLKQKRPAEDVYESFVDTFMESAKKVFGAHTLIQFEDFANQHANKFLNKYRDRYTMFNDDIQGTAAVTLAGIKVAERFTKKKLVDSTILFVGAGEAAVGIANLLVIALQDEGISEENAIKKIYMKRSTGLVKKSDKFEANDDGKKRFAKDVKEGQNTESLVEIVKWVKPNILIGVSSTRGVFTKEVLEEMAKNNEYPIIFPLSNPLDKSECTAAEAYTHTQGKALFASGSPFEPFDWKGQLRKPQQCNNAYIFPGVALAITVGQMTTVPERVFLIAAETLANKCTLPSDYQQGSLFPRLEQLRECSVSIATKILKYVVENTNGQKKLTLLTDIPKEEEAIKNYITRNLYKPSGVK